MKRVAVIIIAVVILVSIALNIRLILILEELEESQLVDMFKGFQRDDAILYHLQNVNQKKSEEMLLEDVKAKGILFFIFTEEGRLSEKAIKELDENKQKYTQDT